MSKNKLQPAIGILGGTFDPIHNGHLRPCLDLIQQLNLAQIALMPNHIPPHKAAPGSSSAHRVNMVEASVKDCVELTVDERELNRETASYTIDTLIELAKEYPRTPLCFLIGMDSLNNFDKWHRWEEILNYCHLIVSYRPGHEIQLSNAVEQRYQQAKITNPDRLHSEKNGHILLWPSTQLDISSTRIRKMIKNQQNPKYLLPDAVITYIKQHNLYI